MEYINKNEKILKGYFKDKFKATTASIVAFLITGAVGYGSDTANSEAVMTIDGPNIYGAADYIVGGDGIIIIN